ncbi:MAG: NAD(P)(+) transhydrogenase (Re/Si-specific) subunit beta [Acidobacteria bacterium]|nr:NAD(P)(+) transhydrogenase (Re/Si-specific) subunit beta [Acidobacteriota bacterium]
MIAVLYLISSVLFILGLKMLTRVSTARNGNILSSSAMLLAIVATLIEMGKVDYTWILAGLVVGGLIGGIMAVKVQMTSMPEMVAVFNGFGGGASVLVALSYLWDKGLGGDASQTLNTMIHVDISATLALSIVIGSVTFTGSLVAFAKLKGLISGQPILFPGNQVLNALLALSMIAMAVGTVIYAQGSDQISLFALVLTAIAAVLGILLVTPIGGADMPVVISLLNSYSGLAAAATGFVLSNNLLIISGALVGASGLILTKIMCKAMNRSLANVLFGGFGQEVASGSGKTGDLYPNVKSCGPEECAMIMEAARDVIIVPGYGLAVAQAQHATRELGDLLIKNGATVRYAIHPVAGRMPGHMNVLLAESNVPHELLLDLDQINDDFKNCDVVLILGANDVINPAAEKDPNSPIYGMPILKAYEAKTVIVNKRSLSAGFAAIPNDLFNYDNTLMLFGDAKKMITAVVQEVKEMS